MIDLFHFHTNPERLKSWEHKLGIPMFAFRWCKANGRDPEVEKSIMKDARTAYRYSYDVIRGRWPEAEEVILTDSEAAYSYAKNILKKPWPEAEAVIATDGGSSMLYAILVLKSPWPEGGIYAEDYPDHFPSYLLTPEN